MLRVVFNELLAVFCKDRLESDLRPVDFLVEYRADSCAPLDENAGTEADLANLAESLAVFCVPASRADIWGCPSPAITCVVRISLIDHGVVAQSIRSWSLGMKGWLVGMSGTLEGGGGENPFRP